MEAWSGPHGDLRKAAYEIEELMSLRPLSLAGQCCFTRASVISSRLDLAGSRGLQLSRSGKYSLDSAPWLHREHYTRTKRRTVRYHQAPRERLYCRRLNGVCHGCVVLLAQRREGLAILCVRNMWVTSIFKPLPGS